jgi:TPR repeat protein
MFPNKLFKTLLLLLASFAIYPTAARADLDADELERVGASSKAAFLKCQETKQGSYCTDSGDLMLSFVKGIPSNRFDGDPNARVAANQLFESAMSKYEIGCEYGDDNGCLRIEEIMTNGVKNYWDPGLGHDGTRYRLARNYHYLCKRGQAAYCLKAGEIYANLRPNGDSRLSREEINTRYLDLMNAGCQLGLAKACNDLAGELIGSAWLPKDEARAYEITQFGCDRLSDGLSCVGVGASLYLGRGVAKNPAQAVPFYKKACELKYGTGCYLYAYVTSKGVAGALDPSIDPGPYYLLGCDYGYADACKVSGDALYEGKGVPADRKRALKLYESACDISGFKAVSVNANDLKACYRFGRVLLDGSDGYTKNEEKGIKYTAYGCTIIDHDYCFKLIPIIKAFDAKHKSNNLPFYTDNMMENGCMFANRVDMCLNFIMSLEYFGKNGNTILMTERGNIIYTKMISLDPVLADRKDVIDMMKKGIEFEEKWRKKYKK